MSLRIGAMLAATCLALGVAGFAMNHDTPDACFRKAYALLHDEADVRDFGSVRLVTNQPTRHRAECGDSDLWHYNLPNDIDGVLWHDCLISWVDGRRTEALSAGIECVPITPTPVPLSTTVRDLGD